MASLSIRQLTKAFGEGRVVDDVSIEVPDGEFIVLVGPSGCGKSTTLRMIAGLEGIDSGTISIAGREVNDLHPADRDIAMVFQSYALYPHMSVYNNIAYGLRRRSVPRAQIEDRVARVAASSDSNPHAFMLEAIREKLDAEEAQAAFVAEAERRLARMLKSPR